MFRSARLKPGLKGFVPRGGKLFLARKRGINLGFLRLRLAIQAGDRHPRSKSRHSGTYEGGDELRQRLARQRAPAPGHLAPPVGRVDLPRHVRQVEVALGAPRSEEHTSELQSLMRISYAV